MCTHVPETMSVVIIRSRFETISTSYYFREKEKEMDKMNGKRLCISIFLRNQNYITYVFI